MEGQNVLLILFAIVSAAVAIWTISKKTKNTKSEAALLREIEAGENFGVQNLVMLSIESIRKHYAAILNAYTEILQKYIENETISDEDILLAIDEELSEINSINDEAKKELIYDIFVTACCKIELKNWIPIIAKMALLLNQEEAVLKDANAVYFLFSDIAIFSEDFEVETFAEDCLWSIENLAPTDLKNKAREILDDFTFIVNENIKNKKIGG